MSNQSLLNYATDIEFKGHINSVTFKDKQIMYSTLEILQYMESELDITQLDDKFIQDLALVIETVYLKYDDISYNDIEKEFIQSLYSFDTNTQPLTELKFKIWSNDWKFEWFNHNIKNGEYNFIKSEIDT